MGNLARLNMCLVHSRVELGPALSVTPEIDTSFANLEENEEDDWLRFYDGAASA